MSIIIKFEEDFYKNLTKYKEKYKTETKKSYFGTAKMARTRKPRAQSIQTYKKEDSIKLIRELENVNFFFKKFKIYIFFLFRV